MLENIYLTNPKNTKLCHFKSGEQLLIIQNVQSISHNASFIVSNVTFLSVYTVFHAHDVVHILKSFESKKELLQRDLQELKNYIHPSYCEILSSIKAQRAEQNINSLILITNLQKQGEILHKEIDNIISELKSRLCYMDSKHLDELNKEEGDITRSISDITQIIGNLDKVLDSNDVSLVSAY